MGASPPAILITVEDNGLGIQPTSTDGASFKIGVSSTGTPNTVYNAADPTVIRQTLGNGPLPEESVYHANKSAGKPQYLIPANNNVAATIGSITHSGSGPVITSTGSSPLDTYSGILTIVAGGNQGVGTFQLSLDGGDSEGQTLTIPTSGQYTAPNTGVVMNFPAGTASGVTHVGSGSPVVTIAGTSTTLSNVTITISTGGLSNGTAQFTYAINGGSASTPQAIPNGGGTFLVPGTGMTATFANGTYVLNDTYSWTITGVPYVAGDTYSFTTVAPGYDLTSAGNALVAMIGSAFAGRFVKMVGYPASAAAAAALVALVETDLETAAGGFKFMRGLVDMPLEANASDSQLVTAFSSVAAPRVGACARTAQVFSDIFAGRGRRTSSGALAAPRLARAPISDDLGWTGSPLGTISAVNTNSTLWGTDPNASKKGLFSDETVTPGLDAARFTTIRTYPLVPGTYITKGHLMAAPGSDFSLIQYGIIMDVACEQAYFAAFPFLNAKLPTDPTTGFILDDAASGIEEHINGILFDALVTPGHASNVTTVVGRTNNILSDGTLYVKIRIQPDGCHDRHRSSTSGFVNPVILAAAAWSRP